MKVRSAEDALPLMRAFSKPTPTNGAKLPHLCGPNGAKEEFQFAAAAQILRKLAKVLPLTEPRPA